MALQVLDEIKKEAGPDNVNITLGYVGSLPSAYPINTIFLWTSGPQEGVFARGSAAKLADASR